MAVSAVRHSVISYPRSRFTCSVITHGMFTSVCIFCAQSTFLFFADPNHDRELKRLMRDHVHYRRDIYEAAAAGVDQMGGLGNYTSLHIRRGDFQ